MEFMVKFKKVDFTTNTKKTFKEKWEKNSSISPQEAKTRNWKEGTAIKKKRWNKIVWWQDSNEKGWRERNKNR